MPRLSKIGAAALAAFGWTGLSSVTASYLVVAGGGGGGSGEGAGGGGGGYQTSTLSLNPTQSYTVTVGGGGAAGVNLTSAGVSGTNSVFSTITSTGGGGGGTQSDTFNNGLNGGSGGGAASNNSASGANGTGGTGVSGQGFAGGAGYRTVGVSTAGGGGGGASAVGTGAGSAGGAGGAGSTTSISGTSTGYAGGGGGGSRNGGGTATQGGGAGSSGNGTAGTTNTGGGGGAGGSSANGGAGGSGVVIISYPAPQKFGGGVVTTSGSNVIHTFNTSGTLSPLSSLTASYLIVAGGAGGAYARGGGGGAGGLLSGSSLTIDTNSNYLVTVGAGGAGGTSGTPTGTNGTNSAFTMVTTTAVGGGGGGTPSGSGVGVAGGSGGGGGSDATSGYAGGAGTSGQGYAGGQGNPLATVLYGAGGGGGAGAVGSAGTALVGGNGGVGVASSISGTSTYYAGGGGGGIQNTGTAGSGGNGGGGAGGAGSTAGTAGTTNLGAGGGGGGGTSANGGAGGSGVVIISYAGSTQQMAGGTVTITGGNVIHTFTSSGYLTPIKYVNNSLRFRSSASAYLKNTFTAAGNRKTYTISFWMKRGKLATQQLIFTGFDGSISANIQFTSGDLLALSVDGNVGYQITTTQVFRDPAAWYHFVFAVDTTQATAANRLKMYVNGVQVTALSSSSYPPQNNDTYFFGAFSHWIGSSQVPSVYTDGYLTEFNGVNGQALTPNSFGTFNSYGVWQPITYGGSYGTNGFYLPFTNTTSTTTLGYDFSPNGNNWTTNNISLTTGATYDSMTDVPTLTSATAANYCVLNPLQVPSGAMSDGNLKFTKDTSGTQGARASIYVSSGKWYSEFTVSATSNNTALMVGIMQASSINYAGFSSNSYAYNGSGTKYNNDTGTSYGSSYTTGDVIGVALDLDAGTLTFYKNNTSQGTAFSSLSGTFAFGLATYSSSVTATFDANFGQRPFSYTPPTGFVALNTYNLPASTITNGAAYMNAITYAGAGAGTVITSGFYPDFAWMKNRTSAFSNFVQDSVRGGGSYLLTNTTDADASVSPSSTFSSTGITINANSSYASNSSYNFVLWAWKAGAGSTSSNTNGSITSTVSVGATQGFSVVTYTGTGANATVGHGLGVAPSMIILKQRNAVDYWVVWQTALGSTGYLLLNSTNGSSTAATYWNSTLPTSSVFSLGSDSRPNGSTITYVAYCFSAVAGYSAFGSYTGNGSTDGPFVFTNFRPRFVMVKRTDTAGNDWIIWDTSRDTYNVMNDSLAPNLADAEKAGTTNVDFLSNGFKLRFASSNWNTSGATYIYACFAENPLKYANAR